MTTNSEPEPELSLNRQVVLEEDEYTAALSKIIARDFFPSLVHLDATNEYLDALQTKDPQLITASVRRLEEINTPRQTPYGGSPYDTPRDSRPSKRARYDPDLSLDAFQARYTSEDNSSFTQILDEENRQRRQKYGWAWDAQTRVEQQRVKMLEARERMLIEPPPAPGVREKFLIEPPSSAGLITAGEEEQEDSNLIQTEPDTDTSQLAVDPMAPTRDTRTAGVDGWKFQARNSLMFPPDADEAPYQLTSRLAPKTTKGETKAITHANTRLPEQEHGSSVSEPPSPTRSRIDAAISGTRYRPRSPTTDNSSLVPNLPSPTPDQLGPAAVKQLMTWGTLNATPRILSRSDDPVGSSTPFRISEPSVREQLSHKLSNNASKSLRAKAELFGLTPSKKTRKGSMGPPSWTPRKSETSGNLTPAAKRLLDRTTMGALAARRVEDAERRARWQGGNKETDLSRVRWTPTPSSLGR